MTNDPIWLVVRKDGKDMHSTTYNGRKIRAYKTEGMAKSQAKRWNAPFQTRVKGTGQWSGGEFGRGEWIKPKYETIEHDTYTVVKYVPAEES